MMQHEYSLLGLSLIFLLIGSECLPLQRRSTVNISGQPARCRLSRPRSTSQCPKELQVRNRYFLHQTMARGCKKLAICRDDAAVHDNRTLFGEGNYFLSHEDCQRECMQYVSCPELAVGDNLVVVSDNGLQGWGRKVSYKCNAGYSLSDNAERYTRMCQKNGTWSGVAPVCLEQCQAPPPVKHAHIAPAKDLYDHGGSVHYTCQVGYELKGSKQRTCSANGQWTNLEPSCVCQVASATDSCPTCPELSTIENGQLSAPNRSLFAEAEYRCDPGYILIGSRTRVCNEQRQWSGEEPICWKLSIVKTVNQHGDDEGVTNETVALFVGSTDITFAAVCSSLLAVVPQWTFNNDDQLPHGVLQTGLELTFSSIYKSQEQKGIYTINIGNFSAFFKMRTQEAPSPVVKPRVIIFEPNKNQSALLGGAVSFECVISGCPIPNLVWYRDDQVLENGGRTNISTVSSHAVTVSVMAVTMLNGQDSGSYRCEGMNIEGNDSRSVQLSVRGSSIKKRSVKDDDAKTSLCSSSSPDTVTLLGQLRRELRHSGMTTSRVQVKRFLRGTDNTNGDGLRKIRTVIFNSEPSERLSANVDYIFQGRIIDKTLFVFRRNVLRHSTELEKHILSC